MVYTFKFIMPKTKLPKKSKRGYVKSLADVTLNDFANASEPKKRIKKPSNNVSVVLKQEVEKSLQDVEKSWDERDEEDFDGNFVSQENEDGTFNVLLQKPHKSSTIKGYGKNYPIDIWFLISDYIRAEDVGKFAAICRTSFEVVRSAKFWFSLYRRYYKNRDKSIPKFPEFLQPENLIMRYGLRKNVIRALYYLHSPFVDRLRFGKIYEVYPEKIETLKNYECQSVWWGSATKKGCDKYYCHFFKMKRNISNCLPHSSRQIQLPDLLETLDDIFANPDEHCKVMKVTCLHLNYIQPQIIGLSLKSFSINLSQGQSATKTNCLHNKIQLVFGTKSYTSASQSGADCTFVLLDPVIDVRVYDWWHPLYPRNSNELGQLATCEN